MHGNRAANDTGLFVNWFVGSNMSTIALLCNNSPVTWTGFHIFSILEFSWKALEKSWKYHGIWFWKVCGHPGQGFCWMNFATGHFDLISIKGIQNSHHYIQKLSGSLEMFRPSRTAIRLCPEIWVNKRPWQDFGSWHRAIVCKIPLFCSFYFNTYRTFTANDNSSQLLTRSNITTAWHWKTWCLLQPCEMTKRHATLYLEYIIMNYNH